MKRPKLVGFFDSCTRSVELSPSSTGSFITYIFYEQFFLSDMRWIPFSCP